MSRIHVAHRALQACCALTLLAVVPTHAQISSPPYIPHSAMPPFEPTPPPPPQCCVPEAITPPSTTGCNTPCDGHADCSGNVTPADYSMAYCIDATTGGGWCARSAHSVYIQDYVCMAMECTINGEPGEQCRWIVLFGSGTPGIGFTCHPSAASCP